MLMHRLGDDYLMLNHVVEFKPGRRISWEPAPGDSSRTEGNDPSKVGIAAGYRWGYILTPDGDDATVVTEVFDYASLSEDLLREATNVRSVRRSYCEVAERSRGLKHGRGEQAG